MIAMIISLLSAGLALLCAVICLWSLRRQPPTANGAIRNLTIAVEKEGILKRRVESLEAHTTEMQQTLDELLRDRQMPAGDYPT